MGTFFFIIMKIFTKSQLFKWHRWLSIISLLPVVFWCLSGLTHPIMANWLRIKPANRAVKAIQINSDSTRIPLQDVLKKQDIKSIQNSNIVNLDQSLAYQIKVNHNINYYDCHTGNLIINGDEIYAKQLARYFVGDSISGVDNIERLDYYTADYKIINRLLPVYKVTFGRSDKMTAYIHTQSSRLGTVNNKTRMACLWLFSTFHNWNFLGDNPMVKTTAVFTFSMFTLITGLIGLWIYAINFKKFKIRKKGIDKLKPRNRHRKLAVATSFILIAFAFSGGFHAFKKYSAINLNELEPNQNISSQDLTYNFNDLIRTYGPIKQVSLTQINNDTYYRILDTSSHSSPQYYHSKTGVLLEDGDFKYANHRALKISKLNTNLIESNQVISRFGNGYGFISKRLPVVKVSFNDPLKTIYYIETSSGIPGSIQTSSDELESMSFSYLHKYQMLNFMGKGSRDLIMSLATIIVLLIALSGLAIFVKMKYKS